MRDDDPDTGARPSDTTTSSTEPSAIASPTAPAAPPPATGTELVAAPELRPTRAADTFAMAGSNGGVRISRLEEVDQYGTGEAARTPPEGGRLLAFQLTDWECDIKPCMKWSALDLRVRVGGEQRTLPNKKGTYVVAVPAGTTTVDLVMRTDGHPQSLSLLTGEPGTDNIAVLARQDRSVEIDAQFRLTESFSRAVDFCDDGTPDSSLVRDVTLRSASLSFFLGDNEPPSVRKAFLVVDASFTLACRPGERYTIFADEMDFRGDDGITRNATPFEGEVDGVEVGMVFGVPADVTGGTLLLGGTKVAFPGTQNEYTVTLDSYEVPFRF
jgi:hypothetical protein